MFYARRAIFPFASKNRALTDSVCWVIRFLKIAWFLFILFLRIRNLPLFCALMYNFLMKKNLVLFFLIISFSASLSFSESVTHESGDIYNLDSFAAYRINADDFSDAFYFLSELPLYPSNDIRMPDVVSGAWSLWKANAIEEKRKEEQKKAEVDFIFSVMKLTFDLLSSIDGSQISD